MIVLVFGGSRCGNCQAPEFIDAVRELRGKLTSQFGGSFARIDLVGVAINTNLSEGLAYLDRFGDGLFDEISVGRGWLNTFAAAHILADTTRGIGAPRVVVTTSRVSGRLAPDRISVEDHRVVAVHVGSKQISDWVMSGATIP